jgi:hypothetical protein
MPILVGYCCKYNDFALYEINRNFVKNTVVTNDKIKVM